MSMSSNKAALQTYGSAELRHYYEHSVKKETDETINTPKFQVLGSFGAKFFNNALNSKVTVGANNYYGNASNSSRVVYRGTFIENALTVYETSFAKELALKVTPYLDAKLPMKDYGTNASLGLYIPFKYQPSLGEGVGNLSVKFGYDVKTFLSSKSDASNRVPLRDIEGNLVTKKSDKDLAFALNDKDEFTVDASARSFKQALEAQISFAPNFFKGMELALAGKLSTKYRPIMELNRETNEVVTRKSSNRLSKTAYETKMEQTYKAVLAYKLTKQLKIANSFYVEPSEKANVYTNLLTLEAKLF